MTPQTARCMAKPFGTTKLMRGAQAGFRPPAASLRLAGSIELIHVVVTPCRTVEIPTVAAAMGSRIGSKYAVLVAPRTRQSVAFDQLFGDLRFPRPRIDCLRQEARTTATVLRKFNVGDFPAECSRGFGDRRGRRNAGADDGEGLPRRDAKVFATRARGIAADASRRRASGYAAWRS